jgi:hypothetical protein
MILEFEISEETYGRLGEKAKQNNLTVHQLVLGWMEWFADDMKGDVYP